MAVQFYSPEAASNVHVQLAYSASHCRCCCCFIVWPWTFAYDLDIRTWSRRSQVESMYPMSKSKVISF